MEKIDTPVDKEQVFWKGHIEAYEKKAASWETKGRKIVKLYRDADSASRKKTAYNILWSNVQTLKPALYSGLPIPNVDRRYKDDEDVNTTVAQVIEPCLDYFVKQENFNDCLKQATLDRLLPGRGTAWVRYVPHFQDVQIVGGEEVQAEGVQVTEDIHEGDEAEKPEELYSEDAVLDYVHWEDFGHSVARTWQEVRAVWRKVYLSKREAIGRFGEEKAALLPYEYSEYGANDEDKEQSGGTHNKALVYELWDRVTKKAFWLNPSVRQLLDVKDDPLRLKGFFPCPKPIFATIANDNLIPTPDYVIYQDQAKEVDTLTQRIEILNKALKVAGVYDANAEGVQRLLSENVDNKLIPVEQWAVFGEKGGLKGVIDFLPIEMVSTVLQQLYIAREKAKAEIYELTGISDIIRGHTSAKETATAQRIKGQFATLRLDDMQGDVERFSRDCVQLIAEVIAEHFSIDTIKELSGIRLLTEAEKQQIIMTEQLKVRRFQELSAQGGNVPQPQPLDEEIKKLLDKPTWEQIEQVLRNEGSRCFKVNVQTDSTIKADQEADKAARIEFLTAAGTFIREAAAIGSPELQPLLMTMLRFGIGGFKAGRELEDEFDTAFANIRQKIDQPPAPLPDPMAEANAKIASNEKIEMAKIASNEKIEMIKAKASMGIEPYTDEEKTTNNQALMMQEQGMQLQMQQIELMHQQGKALIQQMQMQQQDMVLRQQQAGALIKSLTSISNQITQLNENMTKPIEIQRDSQGNLIGAI